MQRWITLFEANCDPNREAEFNDWYDNVHVPDVLATPGYRRARRYVNREFRDGRGKYLAAYDIETDDIAKTMQVRLARREEERKAGRGVDSRPNLVFMLWRDVLFRQIFELAAPGNGSGKQKWINLVEQNNDPTREAEYHQWYNEMHIPDILKTPGFVKATRYEIREPRDGRGRFFAVYEIETDDIAATMKERLAKREEETRAGRASASRNHLTRAVWRDVMWKLIVERSK